jgi:hypothetical protein
MSNAIVFSLIFFLSTSCAVKVRDTLQCSPVFKYVEIEAIGYISMEESYCICRQYRFNEDYVGPVPAGPVTYEPIQSCNKLIGWSPKEYALVSNYWEELRRAIKEALERHGKE